jgi:predicted lactoylglutathione lyase
VDELVNRVGHAGGSVLERPRERPWEIYSGFVQDPDGHLREIMHSPFVDPNAS